MSRHNTINALEVFTERLATRYMKTLEAFLKSLGATPENAHEYQLVSHQGEDWPEVWHQGKPVGKMTSRVDDKGSGGASMVFEGHKYEASTD